MYKYIQISLWAKLWQAVLRFKKKEEEECSRLSVMCARLAQSVIAALSDLYITRIIHTIHTCVVLNDIIFSHIIPTYLHYML